MPKKRQSPKPALRFQFGSWYIVWNYDRKQYSLSLAIPEKDRLFAERWRIDFELALAADHPAFPKQFAGAPAVRKYCAARYGLSGAVSPSPSGWIDDYAAELSAELSSEWARNSLSYIRRLENACGSLDKISPGAASKYLADMASVRSPGTRNRALAACSRFYKWLVRTGRAGQNPFAGIAQMREERRIEIVHCTADQRAQTIEAARSCGWPDWIAVPIALYTGMRRGEIERLRWDDIREHVIVVNKTKTGRGRLIPISSSLAPYLADRGTGYVVQCPEVDRAHRLETLSRHLRRLLPDDVPCGWNIWRHTFGSLLAQNGVSLDKICSWMGNTPDVARRHYAQFVPRDGKDADIDKM